MWAWCRQAAARAYVEHRATRRKLHHLGNAQRVQDVALHEVVGIGAGHQVYLRIPSFKLLFELRKQLELVRGKLGEVFSEQIHAKITKG